MTTTTTAAPIAVALDAPHLEIATAWARAVSSHVSHVKIGLESYLRDGSLGVATIRAAAPDVQLFLDLKLHDIPATVAGACRSISGLAPDILTVHAAGGAAMIEAAAQALPATAVAGVTILTSLSADDLAAIGYRGDAAECVVRLARLAVESGARALVCSPLEVALVREAVGPDVLLITPGVRPAGADHDDQSRVATPQSALSAGADLLVIGRPITAAPDIAHAAAAIAAELIG